MTYILAQAIWPHQNALPRDQIMWTFAIQDKGGVTDLAAATKFAANLVAFQTATKDLLSTQYAWNLGKLRCFQLLEEPPRVPFAELNLVGVNSAGGTNDWPPEVAITISYRAQLGSGENPRRRRGRFYFGPLQNYTSGDTPTISSSITTLLATEWGKLLIDTDYTFSVYSRYTHHQVPVGSNINEKLPNGDPKYPEVPEALPASFAAVTYSWIDNAWDTQRRRGTRASTRTVVTPS